MFPRTWLTLILALTAGCVIPPPPAPSAPPTTTRLLPPADAGTVLVAEAPEAHAGDGTLAMRLAFPAPAAYRTLAGAASVSRVVVTLQTPAGLAVEVITVDRAQVKDGQATVRFERLKPAAYLVAIAAYDAAGERLAVTALPATVEAGKTTTVKGTLVIRPATPTTGAVAIETTIEEAIAPPTPQPTPTATPSTPGLPVAERLGIATGSGFPGLPEAERNRYLDEMKALGARWIRFDASWSLMQPDGRDRPVRFDARDRAVAASRERGLRVLLVLSYTPTWAQPPEAKAAPGAERQFFPPADLDDYARFCGRVAAHYAPLGVHHYEIWNEPNLTLFWKPAADPGRYTRMLKAAYQAIKAADPEAVVVSGGLSPAPDNGKHMNPRTFLKGMYAAGAKGHFDALGHHPYTYGGGATPSKAIDWNAWYQMTGAPESLRTIMAAHGDGARAVWATEFGAPTGGPADQAGKQWISEAAQRDNLKDGLTLWRGYEWGGPIFLYSLRDRGTSPDTREHFFGLLRHDWSKKPAHATVQTLFGGTRSKDLP